jgi:hypothetical protein
MRIEYFFKNRGNNNNNNNNNIENMVWIETIKIFKNRGNNNNNNNNNKIFSISSEWKLEKNLKIGVIIIIIIITNLV